MKIYFPLKMVDFSIVMIVFAGCFLIFADIGSLQLDPLDSWWQSGGRFKTLELCNAAWGISKMSFDAEKDLQAGLKPGQHPCPHGYKNNTYCHHFKNISEILRYILKWLLTSICELFGEGGCNWPLQVTYLNKAFESVAGHCDSCGGKGKGDESTGESGTSQVSPSGSGTAACLNGVERHIFPCVAAW